MRIRTRETERAIISPLGRNVLSLRSDGHGGRTHQNDMETNVYAICFSPTGSSRRVAEAIARGFAATDDEHRQSVADETFSGRDTRQTEEAPDGQPRHLIDLSRTTGLQAQLPADALAVIAVPVYGGHMAPTARERLGRIRGSQTPAALVVLYGNRAFENALAELAELAVAQGFRPVAAAACIGEHSYSTARHPIAAGRPDTRDLDEAEAFGRTLALRFSEAARQGAEPATVDVRRIARPGSGVLPTLRFIRFVLGYRRSRKRHPRPLLPQTDATACRHCGLCATLCPTGAIAADDGEHTDPTRCIRCCACVKGCPAGARSFETPFAEALSRNFRRPKPNSFLLPPE